MYEQLYQECEAKNNTSNTKFILPKAEIYDDSPNIYPLGDTTFFERFFLYTVQIMLLKDVLHQVVQQPLLQKNQHSLDLMKY